VPHGRKTGAAGPRLRTMGVTFRAPCLSYGFDGR
jgi:hypothetical protein